MARPEAPAGGPRPSSVVAAGLAALLTALVLVLAGSTPPDRTPLAGWAGRTLGLSADAVACIRREAPPWPEGEVDADEVARRGIEALPAADQQTAGDVIVACAVRAAGR